MEKVLNSGTSQYWLGKICTCTYTLQMIQLITFVNYRAQKLNKYSLTRKYLLQKKTLLKVSCMYYNNVVK
jgi:hypothetical protein